MKTILVVSLLILSVAFVYVYEHPAQAQPSSTMNASMTPIIYYYVVMSEKLSEGILFTNATGAGQNVQYPLLSGSNNNNATWNYNQSDKRTEYYVYTSGTMNVDLCIGASNHLCSTKDCAGPGNIQIDAGNMKWKSSFSNDINNPGMSNYVPFMIGYDNTNKVAQNVFEQNVYLRFWLSLPANTQATSYNTTSQIKAVLSGGNCA